MSQNHNKYKGELSFEINGKKGVLCYDWSALSDVKTSFQQDIFDNLNGAEPKTIAKLMEIGFKKHNPEITAKDILADSPPFLKAIEAICLAVTIAHYGEEQVPEVLQNEFENKKKFKRMKRIICIVLFGCLSALGYHLIFSGS